VGVAEDAPADVVDQGAMPPDQQLKGRLVAGAREAVGVRDSDRSTDSMIFFRRL
jgi:hypothetical protein